MRLTSPTSIVWLLVYLALMAGLVVLMLRLRQSTIATYDTPEQQQNWEAWRDAAAQPQGGVDRREPASTQPPALVLMRDYFAMCLAASLVFTTALYLVCTLLLVGMLRRPPTPTEEKIAD